MGLAVQGSVTRAHRTALIVDVTDADSAKSDYEERVERLFQSVNGPNIKVDIFTFDGRGVVAAPGGGGLRPGKPTFGSPTPAAAGALSLADAQDWARGLGYTQILVVAPAV